MASAETFSFLTYDDIWHDAVRGRAIPIRLRLPDTNTAQNVSSKLPLIVFSHGLGGSLASGSFWLDHWANHSFATLNVQHPGSDFHIWSRAKNPTQPNLRERLQQAMQPSGLAVRAGDVRFVLDTLTTRQDEQQDHFKQLDLQRIGMSGHSYGAVTTLALCGQHYPHLPEFHANDAPSKLFDARIRAGLALSPSARNTNNLAEQFGRITMPFFCLTGTHDQIGIAPEITPANRQLPHQHMQGDNKSMLVLDGADHLFFNGRSRQDSAAECGLAGFKQTENPVDANLIPIVNARTLAFWQTYL